MAPGTFKFVIIRAVLGSTEFILWCWALLLLPMSYLSILSELAPFWGSLLGWYMNGEPVRCIEICAMFLCFGCVIGIALGSSNRGEEALTGLTYDKMPLGIGVAIVISLFSAIMRVMTRAGKDTHISLFMYYYGAVGALGPFLALLTIAIVNKGPYSFFVYSDYRAYLWLLLGCILDQICLMASLVAFMSASTGFVSLLAYSIVFWAFLADIFIFG